MPGYEAAHGVGHNTTARLALEWRLCECFAHAHAKACAAVRRAAEASGCELEERRSQLGVLMETIEVLQVWLATTGCGAALLVTTC